MTAASVTPITLAAVTPGIDAPGAQLAGSCGTLRRAAHRRRPPKPPDRRNHSRLRLAMYRLSMKSYGTEVSVIT